MPSILEQLNDVKTFLRTYGKGYEVLGERTDLIRDLGFKGDALIDFMKAFFSAFSVNSADFNFQKHQERRGFSPLLAARDFFKSLFMGKPLTIRMLARAVELGVWDQEEIRKRDARIKPVALCSREELWDDLKHLTRRYVGTGDHLTENTELMKDLHVDGDDAIEFLSDFIEEFSVEADDFDFSRHFNPEGLSLISFSKRLEEKPITLGMLMKAIELGKWQLSEMEA